MSDISTKNRALSFSGDGWVVTPYADDYISRGCAFQVHRILEVPAGGLKIAIDFSSVTDKVLFTMPLYFATNEGQVYVRTYKVVSYTGGTIIPVINRNGLSGNVAQGVFSSGITTADTPGDDLREYIVGALSTNKLPGGGTGGGSYPKVFSNGIIVFDIINKESSAVDLEIDLNWYEVPKV